jgi:hypothetical protein
MPPVGFRLATPATEWPETHVLNRAAPWIDFINKYTNIIVMRNFLRAVAQSGKVQELA